jgi:hypothetical protein
MTEKRQEDAGLEAFFEAARADAPVPSTALMARVLADAEAAQPKPPAVGLIAMLIEAVGGWRGLGGLATAACAGLWIGFAGWADLDVIRSGLTGDEVGVVELMPGGEVIALLDGSEE